MKNCFSIDVEGFLESNQDSFGNHETLHNEDEEIQKNMAAVLSLLDETGTKATFFVLGRVAKDLPGVVRDIASQGHETACHGYFHSRLFNMDRERVSKELGDAKKLLEDVSNSAVLGFRAPDFSITRDNYYVMDVLAELGFAYDSSIYPFGYHDVYGIADAPKGIHRLKCGLVEFPLSTFSVPGLTIPFGGGGYFRLYPLFVTRFMIRRSNLRGTPCMVYQHPYEIGPSIPHVSGLSPLRKFRHYYNCKRGLLRTENLLRSFDFCKAIDIVREAA